MKEIRIFEKFLEGALDFQIRENFFKFSDKFKKKTILSILNDDINLQDEIYSAYSQKFILKIFGFNLKNENKKNYINF